MSDPIPWWHYCAGGIGSWNEFFERWILTLQRRIGILCLIKVTLPFPAALSSSSLAFLEPVSLDETWLWHLCFSCMENPIFFDLAWLNSLSGMHPCDVYSLYTDKRGTCRTDFWSQTLLLSLKSKTDERNQGHILRRDASWLTYILCSFVDINAMSHLSLEWDAMLFTILALMLLYPTNCAMAVETDLLHFRASERPWLKVNSLRPPLAYPSCRKRKLEATSRKLQATSQKVAVDSFYEGTAL